MIRFATAKDVEAISRIHAETWKEAYRGLLDDSYLAAISHERWLGVFTETLTTGSLQVAVCPREGGIGGLGGCLSFGPAREEDRKGWAEIPSIYVLPQFWGQGIGRELLGFAVAQLQKSGLYTDCYLWVLKSNLRARAFYEKMGFILCCDEKFFHHEGQILHEVRYCLNLTDSSGE